MGKKKVTYRRRKAIAPSQPPSFPSTFFLSLANAHVPPDSMASKP